jgi:hypothetical protein
MMLEITSSANCSRSIASYESIEAMHDLFRAFSRDKLGMDELNHVLHSISKPKIDLLDAASSLIHQ